MKRLLLLLLLAVPLASAAVEEGVERYTIEDHSNSRADPPTGNLFDHDIAVENNTGLPVNRTNLHIEVNYIAQIQHESSGVWSWTLYWDDAAVCGWSIEASGGLSGDRVHPIYSLDCRIENVTHGSHDLRLTRTTTTGSPGNLIFETVSYLITQEDFLEPVMSIDITTAADPFLPFVFFGVAIWYGAWRGWFGVVLFSVLGVAEHIFAAGIGISLRATVFWLIMVLIMEMLWKTERFTQRFALRNVATRRS